MQFSTLVTARLSPFARNRITRPTRGVSQTFRGTRSTVDGLRSASRNGAEEMAAYRPAPGLVEGRHIELSMTVCGKMAAVRLGLPTFLVTFPG